jgi:hypothetical protein
MRHRLPFGKSVTLRDTSANRGRNVSRVIGTCRVDIGSANTSLVLMTIDRRCPARLSVV